MLFYHVVKDKLNALFLQLYPVCKLNKAVSVTRSLCVICVPEVKHLPGSGGAAPSADDHL